MDWLLLDTICSQSLWLLQLWEQLKSDADASFSGASALILRSEDAQQAAAAFEEKLDSAKMYAYIDPKSPCEVPCASTIALVTRRKADTADRKLQDTKTAAEKAISSASDAMAGCMAGQQGSTPESLDRLAISRLDRWRKAHPTAASFQASTADIDSACAAYQCY